MVGISVALFFVGIVALALLLAGLVRPRWGMPWSQQATRLKSSGLWLGVFFASSILIVIITPRDEKKVAPVEASAPAPAPAVDDAQATEAPAEVAPEPEAAASAQSKGDGDAMWVLTTEVFPACTKALRAAVKFGTEVDGDWDMYQTKGSVEKGLFLVPGQFKLMNGLGLMVPHRTECLYSEGAVKNVSAEPGS